MRKDSGIPKPMDRRLFFSEQVDQKSILTLTSRILEINDDDDYLENYYELHGLTYTPPPIEIYIDSYGGAIYQVFGLLGVMEASNTEIHTYVTGAAMSAGFVILISGDRRFAYKHSTPLYHQVSSGFWGTSKDLEEKYTEVKRLQKKMEEITLERTKIPKKKLKKIYTKKVDWYMTAEEALELGVVDEIV